MTIKPHSSFYKVRGILTGKNNPKFHREGTTPNGSEFQAINFGVKTSEEQVVYVESFGTKNEKAYAYNKNEKKTIAIDWDKRDQKLPEGYRLITPDYDTIEKVINEFEDGDSVLVTGELDYQESNDKLYVKQIVKNVFKTKNEVDFSAENFEEEAIFTQEITINTVEYVKNENKIYINAFIFMRPKGKGKPVNIVPAVFVVEPDKDKKFASNIMKMKYGDTIKVDGIIHSRATTEEVVEDDGWGKKHKTINGKRKEYEVIGAYGDTYQPKLYKEEEIQEAYQLIQAQNEIEKTFNPDTTENENATSSKDDKDETPDWLKD